MLPLTISLVLVSLPVCRALLLVEGAPNLENKHHDDHQATKGRTLQDDLVLYRANYQVQFHLDRGTFCQIGTPPYIRFFCRGSGIKLLNVSDPSIRCTTIPEINENGWTYLECENTCSTDAQCQEVYQAVGGDYVDGPFGTITYQCESNVVNEVDASVDMLPGEDYVCAGSDGRIDHYLRLGVLCPNNNPATTTTDTYYVYDDFFFECQGLSSNRDNIYTCYNFETCESGSCPVPQISIQADHHLFQDQCITPTVPVTLAPTRDPSVVEPAIFEISAQFEAAWGNLLDPGCSSNSPTVYISCPNSEISSVQALFPTITCTKLNKSSMECSDSNLSNIENRFTGVRYLCTGPALPTSSIEYPEQDAYCTTSTRNSTVRHAVQLGVFCKLETRDTFIFLDLFFECSDQEHEFELLSELASTRINATRLTCTKTASFPVGSTGKRTIPLVGIETDSGREDYDDGSCHTLVRTNNTAAPRAIPTRAPLSRAPTSSPFSTFAPTTVDMTTSVPVTSSTPSPPESEPTQLPLRQPHMALTPIQGSMLPVAVPNAPVSAGNDRNTGIIVGSSVGGTAVVIVIIGLVVGVLFRRQEIGAGAQNAVKPDPIPMSDFVMPPSSSEEELEADSHTGLPTESANVLTTTAKRPSQISSVHSSPVSTEKGTLSSRPDSYDSAHTYSPSSATRRILDVPRPVHYKDQTREVPPLVNVQPYHSLIGGDRPTPLAVATTINNRYDTSHVSTESGYSNRSADNAANRRQAIDP